MKMEQDDVKLMMSNPFYCLPQVDEAFGIKHEPLINEDTFVKVGVRLINEIGAEEYIKSLLRNLKGEFPKSTISGYDLTSYLKN